MIATKYLSGLGGNIKLGEARWEAIMRIDYNQFYSIAFFDLTFEYGIFQVEQFIISKVKFC